MIVFNLMALFRQFVINSKTKHRLSTLRLKPLQLGYIIKEGPGCLKLALNLKKREWFTIMEGI
jgi:hypothetical protein